MAITPWNGSIITTNTEQNTIKWYVATESMPSSAFYECLSFEEPLDTEKIILAYDDKPKNHLLELEELFDI